MFIAAVMLTCDQGSEAVATDGDNSSASISVATNPHFLQQADGNPFFWLGDTGWLLFKKLTREEAETYLEDRQQKGFNVIQVMVIHDLNDPTNVYGDSAFLNLDVAQPLVTAGDASTDSIAYDYWDHVDYIVELAAGKGIHLALVPIWGSNVKAGGVSSEQADRFGSWLAERYKDHSNVIWLNGGDVRGSDSLAVWQALGRALHRTDPDKLITFHPFGRTQSSTWFHDEDWLDFNMFQSGHRRYDQDDTEKAYGEDNWRYVEEDYQRLPTKPVLDGEPSYEGIPEGLHDTLQPYWTDAAARRYAYWSVFAGAPGHTYGHSAIMQFYRPGDKAAYGAREYWTEALHAPGAAQMQHLKTLMLSRPYYERIPDQTLIADGQGTRYDYLIATRGNSYAFIYTYTGRTLPVAMGKISGTEVHAAWFDPRSGEGREIGKFANEGVHKFDPPGEETPGNDWVLILDSIL